MCGDDIRLSLNHTVIVFEDRLLVLACSELEETEMDTEKKQKQ